MLRGGFPGQEEAFRQRIEELKTQRIRASRRGFMAAAVAGVAGSAGGYVLGACVQVGATKGQTQNTPDAAAALDPALEDLRKLAAGPLEGLLASGRAFLTAAPTVTASDRMFWLGVTRLASAGIERHAGFERVLRAGLLILRDRPDLPTYVKDWLDLLAAQPR